MASFLPRQAFHALESLPRAYFLGHHKKGLESMKTLLSQVDLIIECRDFRIPLASRNPLFEDSFTGRARLVVYTKRDLVDTSPRYLSQCENSIRKWQAPAPVMFLDNKSPISARRVLEFTRDHALAKNSLVGLRIMVVGMPNVGKSSLLNALRASGVRKGKAATTGAQPGVTRKISTAVKIIEGEEGSEGVYLLDTPGVFIPYVRNDESMLKLALCGSVKDGLISPTILTDYLLFHLNLHNPGVYGEYCRPTNDVSEFVSAVALKTGRLQKGGNLNEEATALWIIQRWRTGHLGRFFLDDVSSQELEWDSQRGHGLEKSFSQALREHKAERKDKARQFSVDRG